MLNCSELIDSYKKNNFGKTYLPTAVKRKYYCDLNDITRSEVKIVDDKYKTSAKHLSKRQKI